MDASKAFKYLAMAARKSLNVYAVAEAESYFRRALAIYDQSPSCADPPLASPVVVGLLETLMLKGDYRDAGAIATKYMPVVKQAGETPELVTAYYYQTLSLVQRYELRAAHALMSEGFEVAERIGDGRARAYARAGLMHCRTRLGLDTFEEAERRKAELMEDCRKFDDNFLRNSAYFVVLWDYIYRGLVKDARAIAVGLIASGETSGDPRAISFANWMLGGSTSLAALPKRRSPMPMNVYVWRSRRSTGCRERSSARSRQSSPAVRVRDWRRSRRSTPNSTGSAPSTTSCRDRAASR